jgi:hypothetical protein
MIVENKPNYYIGTVTYVESDPLGLLTKDKLYHEAVVAVPGVFENVLAFPGRNQLDEPKVGDLVVVCSWDPVYNSYCTYEKLKENDFVGFRSSGKMVQITHDKIVVGVFDESQEYKDDDVPDVSKLAHLEMDKEGNITVHAAKNITVNGDADCTITIKGNSSITINGNNNVKIDGNSEVEVGGNLSAKVSGNMDVEASGNANIKAGGSAKIDSPSVTITGGQLTVNGSCSPTGSGGFCGIPVCPLTGAPHIGTIISGT